MASQIRPFPIFFPLEFFPFRELTRRTYAIFDMPPPLLPSFEEEKNKNERGSAIATLSEERRTQFFSLTLTPRHTHFAFRRPSISRYRSERKPDKKKKRRRNRAAVVFPLLIFFLISFSSTYPIFFFFTNSFRIQSNRYRCVAYVHSV